MPDPRRLYELTRLRKQARVSLKAMARHCGLSGERAYESASAWERGISTPQPQLRYGFLRYLAQTLGLAESRDRLEAVWAILVDEWGWELLSAEDWVWIVAHDDQRSEPGASASDRPDRPRPQVTLMGDQPAQPEDAVPPRGPLPPGSRLPYGPNPAFVGRSLELRTVATILDGAALPVLPNKPVTIALVGPGGIGKTQLAVECAQRLGPSFHGGIFWLSFAAPEQIAAEVAACGAGMGLRPDFAQLSRDRQVHLVSAAWEQPAPRLLIFDNCEDPALVRRWRPQSGGCRVLITSRRATWDADLGVQTVPLGLLRRSESVALLQHYWPGREAIDPQLIAIAAVLDDLPLALHLAGSYLARAADTTGPAVYLTQIRSVIAQSLAHPSLQGVDQHGLPIGSPTAHLGRLDATFAVSYRQLDPSHPVDGAARRLLHHAAVLAPGEPIPAAFLIQTLAETPATVTAQGLERAYTVGLLQPLGARGLARMHHLVGAYLRALGDTEPAERACERAALALLEAGVETDRQPDLVELMAHLRLIVDRAARRSDAVAADLCFFLSELLHQIADSETAYRYNARSIAIRTALAGDDTPTLADNYHHQGWMLDAQSRQAEAQVYHERGLALRLRHLGPDHLKTAESHNYLGTVLHACGHFAAALDRYTQAFMIRRSALGSAHPLVAQCHNNLGLLLHMMGRLAEADQHYQVALAIREATLPARHPRLAITLNNLGYLLRAQARYAEAEVLLRRALAIREYAYGPENTYCAVTLSHLGRIAQIRGDYLAARALLERAMGIRDQELGAEHADSANNQINLGKLAYDEGDLDAAEALVRAGLAIHERIWAMPHWHHARGYNQLGLIALARGQLHAAQAYLERALALRLQILGDAHPNTANTQGHLGLVMLQLGDQAAATPLLQAAVVTHQHALGARHPTTARSLWRLAQLHDALGDHDSARSVGAQALATYQCALGADHCRTAQVHEWLKLLG